MNTVQIPADRFNMFLDKFEQYLEAERDTIKKAADVLDGGLDNLVNTGFERVAVSIDNLSKAVSKLARLGRDSSSQLETVKEINTITHHTKEIQNNTEVIWEETSTGNEVRESSASVTHKLLREIRNPLESLSYTLSPDFLDNLVDVLSQSISSNANNSHPSEGILVRLSDEQIAAINAGFNIDALLDALRNNQNRDEENNQRNFNLFDALFGWLRRSDSSRRRREDEDRRIRLRDTTFVRAAWSGMTTVMYAIRDEIIDMRLVMAFKAITGVIGEVMNLGGIAGMFARGLGKGGLAFAVGDIVLDYVSKMLDTAQASSPEWAAQTIQQMRDWYNELMTNLFGEGTAKQLAETMLAGLTAVTAAGFMKDILIGIARVIPGILARVTIPSAIIYGLYSAVTAIIEKFANFDREEYVKAKEQQAGWKTGRAEVGESLGFSEVKHVAFDANDEETIKRTAAYLSDGILDDIAAQKEALLKPGEEYKDEGRIGGMPMSGEVLYANLIKQARVEAAKKGVNVEDIVSDYIEKYPGMASYLRDLRDLQSESVTTGKTLEQLRLEKEAAEREAAAKERQALGTAISNNTSVSTTNNNQTVQTSTINPYPPTHPRVSLPTQPERQH